jgi:hypothetical protein
LKEATPARQFFERSNSSFLVCLLLVFLTRDEKEQKESFLLIKNARVFSFAFLFINSAKKSKKTFEDSFFADHINHMRVK